MTATTDGRFKAVKMYAPITNDLLGYQVFEVDDRGYLLRRFVRYEDVETDGHVWQRREVEKYYSTAEDALQEWEQ